MKPRYLNVFLPNFLEEDDIRRMFSLDPLRLENSELFIKEHVSYLESESATNKSTYFLETDEKKSREPFNLGGLSGHKGTLTFIKRSNPSFIDDILGTSRR